MNQTADNNELKTHLDTMMNGLNGMTDFLKKNIHAQKSNMTKEQAIEFSKAMKSSNIDEHMAQFEKVSKDLKDQLNID